MPFGRKKQDFNGQEDSGTDSKSGKGGLFSLRSKNKSPAPATNPYTAPPPSKDFAAPKFTGGDPRAAGSARNDPYVASNASFTQPPSSSLGSLSLKSEGTAPPPYTNSTQPGAHRYEKSPIGRAAESRFQAQGGPSYSAGAGYGTNSFGSSSQGRTNGYGGLARTTSQGTISTDANRNALFGAAPQRAQKQVDDMSQAIGMPPQSQDTSYHNAANYGSDSMPGGYGYNESPPRTQQEIDDADVGATKDAIKEKRKETEALASNASTLAEQTEALALETLARLAGQGERLHNAERNLDLSHHQNVLAKGKADELTTLNRSMFAVHVDNPFTKGKRERAMLELASERRREERDLRSETQASRYESQARQQKLDRDLGKEASFARPRPNYADRAKYMFEADPDDEETEDQIDAHLDRIGRSTRVILKASDAMSKELDKQNEHITKLGKKTDKLDDGIARNRARLGKME